MNVLPFCPVHGAPLVCKPDVANQVETKLQESKLRLTSSVFVDGWIPQVYTCEGTGISPPLTWTYDGQVRSFALVVDDPDAIHGTFTHWVIYDIPGDARELTAGISATTATFANGIQQGTNSAKTLGYTPPCPPDAKPHHYQFKLYALDLKIGKPGLTKEQLEDTLRGYITAQTTLVGIYQNSRSHR